MELIQSDKEICPAIEQEMTNDIPSNDCTTGEPKYPQEEEEFISV